MVHQKQYIRFMRELVCIMYACYNTFNVIGRKNWQLKIYALNIGDEMNASTNKSTNKKLTSNVYRTDCIRTAVCA